MSAAAAMRSPKVRLRWIPTGQLVCREGEPPGPLYLICSGLMRVYRRDQQPPHGELDLARVGTGDVVGELAPLLNQPRSASVQALEPTQVLEIDVNDVGALLEQQAPLRRVLGLALHERAGMSPHAVATLATRLGISLNPDLPAAPTPPTFAEPDYDAGMLYAKPVSCPACSARFSALVPRTNKLQPAQRSSDFLQTYRTALNPNNYELWVCPNCLYAAFPADFADLPARQHAQVVDIVSEVVQGWGGRPPEFNVDRTPAHRERALLLALALYRMRGAGPLRLASILHRLAWCARERDDQPAEQTWLSQALAAYASGYRDSELEPREELRVLYLCGELSLRLGSVTDALQWFGEGLRHAALKDHQAWERAIREQWTLARGAAIGESEADPA